MFTEGQLCRGELIEKRKGPVALVGKQVGPEASVVGSRRKHRQGAYDVGGQMP
jgi:hypothetical protein